MGESCGVAAGELKATNDRPAKAPPRPSVDAGKAYSCPDIGENADYVHPDFGCQRCQ